MSQFQIGETIICSIEVRTDAGTLFDPVTSMNIIILTKSGATIISSTAMTKDSVGKYHYDFTSASHAAGEYIVKYTATDVSRITIQTDKFTLES